MHGSFGRRKHQYTYTLLLLFKIMGQQGSHSALLKFSFFVCYWGVRSFLQRHIHFALTWDFFFYCSVENLSNLKILRNLNTVTIQFICGSWKPGNTAYFFHPVLQNPFYRFCHFILGVDNYPDVLFAGSCVQGKLFLFLEHFSLQKSWIKLSKYPVYVNKCLIKQSG